MQVRFEDIVIFPHSPQGGGGGGLRYGMCIYVCNGLKTDPF